ncbi:hypothetical protein HKX48_005797 [Thoreauomyces humboldtii]|nr:hypothetical protein HKX48_005797 [Thoreauomyces humboldtii]
MPASAYHANAKEASFAAVPVAGAAAARNTVDRPLPPAPPAASLRVRRRAVALVGHVAGQPGEMSYEAGDVIEFDRFDTRTPFGRNLDNDTSGTFNVYDMDVQ